MRVKVPNQIKIAGRIYKVLLEARLVREQGNRGEVRWDREEIALDTNLNLNQRTVSFLHELVHIIDEHFCCRSNISEEITSGLAEGLFQLLKDNFGIEFEWEDIC